MSKAKQASASTVPFLKNDVGSVKTRLRDDNIVVYELHRNKHSRCESEALSLPPSLQQGQAAPPPPDYLADDLAKREWNAIAPMLSRRGILDETMKPLLAGYCSALARSVRAEAVLAKEGSYYKTGLPGGSTMKRRHPAVQDAENGWAAVRSFAKQLGLSSASTSTIRTNDGRREIFK